MEPQHSPEYRTVAVFGCLTDAELARGLLEADGIAAAVLEGGDAALFPGVGREVRVLVPTDDLSRARELLAEPAELAALEAEELVPSPSTSPAAEGSWTLPWLALIVALGLFAAALAM